MPGYPNVLLGEVRKPPAPQLLTLQVYSVCLDSWLPCCCPSRGSAPPFPTVQTGDPAPPSPAQAFLGGKARWREERLVRGQDLGAAGETGQAQSNGKPTVS